jgi:spore maturation protein CgeB
MTTLRSPLRIVMLGLSITSSWGNGHATNYRALVRALTGRGHDVLFLERDVPWYAAERDLPDPPWGRSELYASVGDLQTRFGVAVTAADVVLIGSYVPDGIEVARWVTSTTRGVKVFYDIDTPVTLAALERGECDYLEPHLIREFDLYLSFTGGPTLDLIEDRYAAPRARAFYCLVDDTAYRPMRVDVRWDLGYLGTYSADRQPTLERLLLEPARQRPDLRFVVAGPQYPAEIEWPRNVARIEHLPPAEHSRFYSAQRFTLNVTRADMVRAGWSPSVRLFEAAACAVPVVSDRWPGLDDIFRDGEEILVVDNGADVLDVLDNSEPARLAAIGTAARRRVLKEHTAQHRAAQFEHMVADVTQVAPAPRTGGRWQRER